MSIAVKIPIFANPTTALILSKVSIEYDKNRLELSYLLFSISIPDSPKKDKKDVCNNLSSDYKSCFKFCESYN